MSKTNPIASPDLWNGKIYNGEWRTAAAGTMEVTEKATGEPLAEIGMASPDDVVEMALQAKQAQREWAAMSGPQRGDILRRFSELVLIHADEIIEWIVRETGSIYPKSEWEVHMTAREVLEAAAMPSAAQGVLLATDDPQRQSFARRIPIGVVGVITPWNSPFLLAARAFGPALAMGNAVLLKPDPQTPVCGGVLPILLLEEAGLPKGLIHLLPGGVDTGEALVSDPNVNMISFTGSTRAGRKVGEIAGGLLKRVSLELGGNNPYIVLEDADLEKATSAGAFGSFNHQGQICLTIGRHIVHESIAEDYTKLLAERVAPLPVGDPFREQVALGPIINAKQADNVQRILDESVAMGARIMVGGKRDGLYFYPTVLADVTTDMPVFKEEIFGPVAPVLTFKTDDEAVELANNTNYGLSAAVQSANQSRALGIANRLHSGIIHINDQTVIHEVYGPIGGVGMSGNGYNYGSVCNADQFTEWQWLTTRSETPPYPF